MKYESLFLSLVLAIAYDGFGQQQKDSIITEKLEEIVLSDSRFPLKRENSGKTVIKISSEEIDENQGRSIAALLSEQAGIEINGSRSNAGQNLGYYIRGGNNRQVLVLIDGIAVYDPSQIATDFDLRLLPLSQIESVEIIKGPSSTLYGSGAATAVISVKTKQPKALGTQFLIESSVGTNRDQKGAYELAEFNETFRILHKNESLSLSSAFNHTYVNGLTAVNKNQAKERDPFSRYQAEIKTEWDISKKLTLDAFFILTKFNAAFDSSFPLEDAAYFSASEQWQTGLGVIHKQKNGSLTLNIAFNRIARDIDSDFPTSYKGENLVLDAFERWNIGTRWKFIAGINSRLNSSKFQENTESILITDPYTNLVFISEKGWQLNVGLRVNIHSEYGAKLIYNFNPSYLYKRKWGYIKGFGSFSSAYIAPSLAQLYGVFGPNPDLMPEINRSLELGTELNLNTNLTSSVLFFNRREDNFIDYVVLDPINFVGQYTNLENSFRAQGFEIQLNYSFIKNWSLNGNYTFTELKDRQAIRIPRHKAGLGLSFQPTAYWNWKTDFQFVGKRLDIDYSSFPFIPESMENYFLWNVRVTRSISMPNARIFLSCFNILDQNYVETIGFTTLGRNFSMGFSLQL